MTYVKSWPKTYSKYDTKIKFYGSDIRGGSSMKRGPWMCGRFQQVVVVHPHIVLGDVLEGSPSGAPPERWIQCQKEWMQGHMGWIQGQKERMQGHMGWIQGQKEWMQGHMGWIQGQREWIHLLKGGLDLVGEVPLGVERVVVHPHIVLLGEVEGSPSSPPPTLGGGEVGLWGDADAIIVLAGVLKQCLHRFEILCLRVLGLTVWGRRRRP
jgi:hypothetical protein